MNKIIATKDEIKKVLLNQDGIDVNEELLESLMSLVELKIEDSDFIYNYMEMDESIRLVRNNITNKFISNGGINLKGLKVDTADDLAAIYKIFRDSRYETFRIAEVKNGEIVRTFAVSSKLPTISSISKYYGPNVDSGTAEKRFYSEIKYKLESDEADGYYLVHNHPSRNYSPSEQDYSCTERFRVAVPGLLGHLIMGGTKASFIKPGEHTATIIDLDDQDVSVEDSTIKNVREISKFAYPYLNESTSMLVFVNNEIILDTAYEIDNKDFNNKETLNSILKLRSKEGGWLLVLTSSYDVFKKLSNGNLYTDVNDKGDPLFLDIIYIDPNDPSKYTSLVSIYGGIDKARTYANDIVTPFNYNFAKVKRYNKH